MTSLLAPPKAATLQGEGERLHHEGIRPISQISFSGMESDFALVGSGEALVGCGSFFTVGCLNVEEHKGMTLEGVSMEGKALLKRRKRSCHRALCPICWGDWANREVKKARARLDAFVLKGRSLKPIHVMVSVPYADYALDLMAMRKKVYASLKRVHVFGGMMIYHPKREAQGLWYFSPHFHIIGYGWVVDVRQNYVYSGYVVKNIGIRKTVGGTIWYQLSHAGVNEKHHTITWFGALYGKKLDVKYPEKEEDLCPLCKSFMRKVLYVGDGECSLPDVEGGYYFDDPSNWVESSQIPRRYEC